MSRASAVACALGVLAIAVSGCEPVGYGYGSGWGFATNYYEPFGFGNWGPGYSIGPPRGVHLGFAWGSPRRVNRGFARGVRRPGPGGFRQPPGFRPVPSIPSRPGGRPFRPGGGPPGRGPR